MTRQSATTPSLLVWPGSSAPLRLLVPRHIAGKQETGCACVFGGNAAQAGQATRAYLPQLEERSPLDCQRPP
eukprot:11178362-Lingulodinium_polyedra.AAC.1